MGLKQIKLVKPKSIALNIASFNEIQSYIDDTYKDVSDKNRLKYLSSFILFVCCIIEEAYQPRNLQNKKVDKKEEVLKHISTFLGIPFTDEEKRVIGDIIEDLHSSKRIKRVSFVQKTLFTIGSFFLKMD
jgi:RecG-like helicase